MKIISSTAQEALDTGLFHARNGFAVTFDDGVAAFWDDAYDIVVSSQTYVGIAGAFTIGTISGSSGMGARSVDITMSGIDSDLASQIMSQPWHQAPITITRFIMATDAPQVIYTAAWFSGHIDTMTRRDKPGDSADVIARCEDIGREITRKGARSRSESDQRQISSGDSFFANVTQSIRTNIDWGRLPAAQPQGQTQSKSWFERIF